MLQLLQDILDKPAESALVIGNLVLIESLLSVDNAAVLATMVLKLPKADRKKALKYGIIGAYIFRGVCLFVASYLIKIWWLKSLGGLYLLYLTIDWLWKRNKQEATDEDNAVKEEGGMFYRATVGRLGTFWATVVSVEIMDLAFSMDNVFAAVAFSDNLLLILCGVFIGILAMRFVAQGFVRLMEHFPFLEACAYIVIGLLGVKLVLSLPAHFYPDSQFTKTMASEQVDWLTSALTIAVFVLPTLTCILFDRPKRK